MCMFYFYSNILCYTNSIHHNMMYVYDVQLAIHAIYTCKSESNSAVAVLNYWFIVRRDASIAATRLVLTVDEATRIALVRLVACFMHDFLYVWLTYSTDRMCIYVIETWQKKYNRYDRGVYEKQSSSAQPRNIDGHVTLAVYIHTHTHTHLYNTHKRVHMKGQSRDQRHFNFVQTSKLCMLMCFTMC